MKELGHNAAGLIIDDKEFGIFRVHRSAFVDEQILQMEKELIFDRSWLFTGHASEIPNDGDFVNRHVAGRPMIMTRGDDGEIRVLMNTCRHRGNLRLPRPQGQQRRVPLLLPRLDLQQPRGAQGHPRRGGLQRRLRAAGPGDGRLHDHLARGPEPRAGAGRQAAVRDPRLSGADALQVRRGPGGDHERALHALPARARRSARRWTSCTCATCTCKQGKTGVLDYTFERYLAEGEPAGMSFLEWVESPMYDPAGMKADFRASMWGSLLTETPAQAGVIDRRVV